MRGAYVVQDGELQPWQALRRNQKVGWPTNIVGLTFFTALCLNLIALPVYYS